MKKSSQFVHYVGFIAACLCSVFLLLTTEAPKAFAIESLPSGVVIGDDTGLHATPEGKYYVDIPQVSPGGIYEKEITIRSLDVEEPFELGFLVKKATAKGPIDFNQYMTMTLTLDGKQIYKGPLLGDGSFDWTIEPLVLGVCRYGSDQILVAHFEMDSSINLADYEGPSELLFEWIFVATRKPEPKPATPEEKAPTSPSLPNTGVEPIDKLLPKTGEELRNMLVAGILIVTIALLIWKQRKEDEQAEEGE